MARFSFSAMKIICIFLLMGSSFYVYQQFGKLEGSRNNDALYNAIITPLGQQVEDEDLRNEYQLVIGKSPRAWLETVNHAVQNKGAAHQEKLFTKHTRPRDGTRQHKHSSRLGYERKRYPWIGREGREEQKNHPRRGTDGKSQQVRESNVNERNHLWNHRSGSREVNNKSPRRKYEELTRKVKPGKPSDLQQETGSIENKKQNKHFCDDSFEYGQMCPTLYTDLGGYCKMDKTEPGGFDCPDIRKKGYNELRSTQLVLTRLLKIFDLVARKHGIKYWITSGTLLGAARHRGFIPWDEDADISLTLDEYIKFFKCCKDEFPEGIFFQSSATDPYLRPTNKTEYRLLKHPVVGLYKRLWNPRLRDTKSCTKYCLEYGCEWADGLMIDIFIAEDTMDSYHLSGVFPLKEMLFEGFRFPVPRNWREILEYKYGDYNKNLGGDNERIPEDNSDPFHSCEELKQARNG